MCLCGQNKGVQENRSAFCVLGETSYQEAYHKTTVLSLEGWGHFLSLHQQGPCYVLGGLRHRGPYLGACLSKIYVVYICVCELSRERTFSSGSRPCHTASGGPADNQGAESEYSKSTSRRVCVHVSEVETEHSAHCLWQTTKVRELKKKILCTPVSVNSHHFLDHLISFSLSSPHSPCNWTVMINSQTLHFIIL